MESVGGNKCILCAREYKSNIYSQCGHEMNISLAFFIKWIRTKSRVCNFSISLCVFLFIGMSKIVFLKIISSSARIRDSYCFFPCYTTWQHEIHETSNRVILKASGVYQWSIEILTTSKQWHAHIMDIWYFTPRLQMSKY